MRTWQKLKNDPGLFDRYFIRETVIDTVRQFFKEQGFHEVSTPTLVPVPSAESNLEVFETQLRTAGGEKRRGFLIMSPEYSIKKLLAAGIGNVFEITRCFRNEEEVSALHNHEFTMLEWYRTGADYRKIMEDCERLFTKIIEKTGKKGDLSSWQYQGDNYDLRMPWQRISVAEVFEKYSRIDTETLLSESKLLEAGRNRNYQVSPDTTWEQMFYQIFFNEIEPNLKKLKRPVFIYDYPLSQAALARKKQSDPRFAERFELFLAGVELGNCFSELTDPAEQAARFEKDLMDRAESGKTRYPVDEDFIQALKSGMPETAGIAVGVDRLVMLAANTGSVAETIFFPSAEIFDLSKKRED